MSDLRERFQELADAGARHGRTPGPQAALRRARQRRLRLVGVTAILLAGRGRPLPEPRVLWWMAPVLFLVFLLPAVGEEGGWMAVPPTRSKTAEAPAGPAAPAGACSRPSSATTPATPASRLRHPRPRVLVLSFRPDR
jgi:hypothetical protein